MNNKSLIILLVLTVFLVTGCKETHNRAIDIAYQLTATAPDSALSVLNGVNQAKLGKADMARYALVYTIAQDKSGLDVDNDSLLRTAYTYYNNREQDSLYAKCEYYMGKYYMLNDSTEKALKCLFNSIRVAEDFRDNKTQVMSLLKLSVITRAYDQDKALKYTLFADSLFKKTKGISLKDRIYIILNVAE